ncbi:MAG: hypothetical protein WC707_00165 [Candidatus Babeliaceae bacterium]|jgi:hypothetical protein
MNKKLFLLASCFFISNALISIDDNADAFFKALQEKLEHKIKNIQNYPNANQACTCYSQFLYHLEQAKNDTEAQEDRHTIQVLFNKAPQAEQEKIIEKIIDDLTYRLCPYKPFMDALATKKRSNVVSLALFANY